MSEEQGAPIDPENGRSAGGPAEAGLDAVGPFRLENLLGRGGMGEVYSAWDDRLARRVALKRLHNRGDSTERRQRFWIEARALASLNHPAIVQIHDILELGEDLWLVMELVNGTTLAEMVEARPLEPRLAVEIGRQIAFGVQVAHDEGVLHRDLKTENVMVLASGQVKILDFGLARIKATTTSENGDLTGSYQLLGTPRAIAPEIALHSDVDFRADLFSFGVLLYEILSGVSPFVDRTLVRTLWRVCHERQKSLSEIRPGLPALLSNLVDRMLEKNPQARPQSMREVANILAGLDLGGDESRPRALQLPSNQSATWIAGRPPSPLRLRRWRPREFPLRPYPLLLPVSHPALFTGQEEAIAEIERRLSLPIPILGVFAASGTGKSSLLVAGLVPRLFSAGWPVALVRNPADPGLGARIFAEIVEDEITIGDEDWAGFVSKLEEIEAHAGHKPLIVLDQAEDVLRPSCGEARARLGVLLAATVRRRPGSSEPACRWLLAYRQDAHGDIRAWLHDVLSDARKNPDAAFPELPSSLDQPDRFQHFALRPLATSGGGIDRGEAACQTFREAIERPLTLKGPDGAPRYPYRFNAGGAERLARAFAKSRLARPEDPLTPELQVVLSHLLSGARRENDGFFAIEIPDDPGPLIDRALEDHLRSALEMVFRADSGEAASHRARVLLVLQRLAMAREGLPVREIESVLGAGASGIFERLAGPAVRLVVLVPNGAGEVVVQLSHDRMAEVVLAVVQEEGRLGNLAVDGELFRLQRLVALKTALHQAGQPSALELKGSMLKKIEGQSSFLLDEPSKSEWLTACRSAARRRRRRRAGQLVVAGLVLFLVASSAWAVARRIHQGRVLLDKVERAAPGPALLALRQGLASYPAQGSEYLESLERRSVGLDVLELGLDAIPPERRGLAVLEVVELALPWIQRQEDDKALLVRALAALDEVMADPSEVGSSARELRERLLAPLHRRRPRPSGPAPDEFIDIPAGRLNVRLNAEGGKKGEPFVQIEPFRILRREVTVEEYRLFEPDHPGEPGHPVAYVDWYDAYLYAVWLGGRLPTAEEWEWAARANCRFDFCRRDGSAAGLREIGWNITNSWQRDGGSGPHPVMQLEPNPWGLYDMFGNVAEWTASWPDDAKQVSQKVLLGGSFESHPRACRPGERRPLPATEKGDTLGMRVVIPARRF